MWVRIDDGMPLHPKFQKLTTHAAWLWMCGNCYSSRYLTDGFVSFEALSTISATPIPKIREQARRLVAAGLWHDADGGFRIHDYHEYNPKAEQVRAKLEADRVRKRLNAQERETPPPPVLIVMDSKRNPSDGATDSNAPRARDPVPSRPVPSGSPEKASASLDVCFAEFQSAYPASRRQGGFMAERGFIGAVESIGFPALLERLEQHKRSEQWLGAKRIPSMRTWFENELWRQELPAHNGPNGHAPTPGRPKMPTVDEIRRANERPQ